MTTENERRLREIVRRNEAGFWRIDSFGKSMLSVVVCPRKKIISCYLGEDCIGTVRICADRSSTYADAAEIFDNAEVNR